MRINNNIMALNAHRQLMINQGGASKSIEKLSSGLRINRAGDDAAGLAISEKMRGQIRGLNQAMRNAQDGISLIQTAEGALNETHSILQRMRELANQAANGTLTPGDRDEIQKEMNQLTSELNRVGNTTEFNTLKLLDGGASASGVARSSTEGVGIAAKAARVTGFAAIDLGKIENIGDNHELTVSIGGTDYTIDGATIKTLWAADDDQDAAALARILNNNMVEAAAGTGKLKDVATVTVSQEGIISFQTLDAPSGGYPLTIQVAADDSWDGVLKMSGDPAGTAFDLTADGTAATDAVVTGTRALQPGDTIDPADWAGRSFTVTANGNTATVTIATGFAGTTVGDLVTAFNAAFDAVFEVGLVKAALDADDFFTITVDAILDEDYVAAGNNPYVSISGDNLDKILGDFVPGSLGSGGTFSAKLQIGANTGQSMSISITDMRALALGVSGTVAGEDHKDVSGARFVAVKDVTDGTSDIAREYSLDLGSHESATAAITVVDNAIQKVSEERSKLGAFQNRLEHTIANLGTSAENLQAAESRIRDVDMAQEMMTFTKYQILQQASTAMLAQANLAPQSVLQLLG